MLVSIEFQTIAEKAVYPNCCQSRMTAESLVAQVKKQLITEKVTNNNRVCLKVQTLANRCQLKPFILLAHAPYLSHSGQHWY